MMTSKKYIKGSNNSSSQFSNIESKNKIKKFSSNDNNFLKKKSKGNYKSSTQIILESNNLRTNSKNLAKKRKNTKSKSKFAKLKEEWKNKKKLISTSLDIFNLTNSKIMESSAKDNDIEIFVGRKISKTPVQLSNPSSGKDIRKKQGEVSSQTRFLESKKYISEKDSLINKKSDKSNKIGRKNTSNSSFEWFTANKSSNNSSKIRSYENRLKESFIQKKDKQRAKSPKRFKDIKEKKYFKRDKNRYGSFEREMELSEDILIENKLIQDRKS
jgi:hypothetical protein